MQAPWLAMRVALLSQNISHKSIQAAITMSISIAYAKHKKIILIAAVILWLYAVFAFALPLVSRAFTGLEESSENPLRGSITCTNQNNEVFVFSMQTPGTRGKAGREGFFGQGEPYVEITPHQGDIKMLRFSENWQCTDLEGNSQPLFTPTARQSSQ